MKLKRNMGEIDRLLRAAMGIGLIYLGPISHMVTSDPMSGALLAALGVLTVAAAVFGWCPLYQISGFSTRRASSSSVQDDG